MAHDTLSKWKHASNQIGSLIFLDDHRPNRNLERACASEYVQCNREQHHRSCTRRERRHGEPFSEESNLKIISELQGSNGLLFFPPHCPHNRNSCEVLLSTEHLKTKQARRKWGRTTFRCLCNSLFSVLSFQCRFSLLFPCPCGAVTHNA